MSDYKIGYKKPPPHSQFKPGNRANPFGRRGKKGRKTGADIFEDVANSIVTYREGGRSKRAPRMELLVKSIGAAALQGDVGAAATLLMLRELFKDMPGITPIYIEMTKEAMAAA